MNRRNFLKLGALFVPVVAATTVAYSFLTAPASAPGKWIVYHPSVGNGPWREFAEMIRKANADAAAMMLPAGWVMEFRS